MRSGQEAAVPPVAVTIDNPHYLCLGFTNEMMLPRINTWLTWIGLIRHSVWLSKAAPLVPGQSVGVEKPWRATDSSFSFQCDLVKFRSPNFKAQSKPCHMQADKAHPKPDANGATGHADPWLWSAAKVYIKHLEKINSVFFSWFLWLYVCMTCTI